METPLHTIINEYGQIEQRRFRLGSGIKDKNGKEIFEGDTVKFKDKIGYVVFRHGDFHLESSQLFNLLSGVDYDGNLEVVD